MSDSENRADSEAETTESENGSVNVGFDFHIKTSRLTNRRLWLSIVALSGALGLVGTVLRIVWLWLERTLR